MAAKTNRTESATPEVVRGITESLSRLRKGHADNVARFTERANCLEASGDVQFAATYRRMAATGAEYVAHFDRLIESAKAGK